MKRRAGVALAALLVIPLAGAVAATAAVPGGNPGPGLAAVGPVSASDGYPVWYQDKNGLRLERCVAQADPLCPARSPLPDETKPVSFPDNYPDEGFYSLAAANLNTANAGKALGAVALEGAFRTPGVIAAGDQVTFARVRIKVTNAQEGQDYKVTLPTGTKTVRTNGKVPGLIFDTEDIGIGGPGDFTGALGGRIGPFLTWDSFGAKTDPALKGDTYVGDGATLHKIKGSPFGSNIFRIEGPGINPATTVDACPTVAGAFADCIETDLFTMQGKVATTAGVTAEQATYSRSAAGSGVVDVYASAPGTDVQSIQVSDATVGAPEFDTTGLVGQAGHYFARVQYTGATPPSQVQVSNVGDVPVTNKTIAVVDRLTGTATYDTGSGQLTVTAGSSDTVQNPALTAVGYGALAAGSLQVATLAPPVSVVLTSAAGGSRTLPVEITGAARSPLPVIAQAGPDQAVQPGQTVTLDGSASSGNISTYAWTSPAGITVSTPDAARTTFVAPTTAGDYTFSLTVNGPGGPSTATVTVTVLPQAAGVTANAGPAQLVQRGTTVTLDGSQSVGAANYLWTQVKITPGDPTVTLTGATTAHPSFSFPKYLSPATNGPLRFQLQVTDAAGTSSATALVDISPTADVVAVTAARYTAGKWRVDGTSSILAGQQMTAHLGGLTGPVIGRIVVSAAGTFSIRPAAGPVPVAGSVVTVESPLGGVSPEAPVRIG